jgi:uroporphyrin-III C-methyltransferase/precorrin-2 dehydrogenase/sirohydrochlorin ferrochelatase
MRFFPVFFDLSGRRALVVGAGPAAGRKAALLAACGAVVVVRPGFSPPDLPGCCLAMAAGAAETDAQALSAVAQAAGVPVNVADRPELCSFIMPAIIDRDPVVVAVSTGGAAPVLARLLRGRIEAALPPGIGQLAAVAGSVAAELRRHLPETGRRRRVLEQAFAGAVAELAFAGREAEARAALLAAAGAGTPVPGFVHFVGAPAEPDLLTLRAQRVLGEADAVLHDPGVPAPVLDAARRDADRWPAGTAAAARLAASGARVVRLVMGDPQAECDREAASLQDVAYAVVPRG